MAISSSTVGRTRGASPPIPHRLGRYEDRRGRCVAPSYAAIDGFGTGDNVWTERRQGAPVIVSDYAPTGDQELLNARTELQVYEAAVIAFESAHELLDIVMRAADRAAARAAIERHYGFSEVQSQAVLDLQVQRLTVTDRRNIEQSREQAAERVGRLEQTSTQNDAKT